MNFYQWPNRFTHKFLIHNIPIQVTVLLSDNIEDIEEDSKEDNDSGDNNDNNDNNPQLQLMMTKQSVTDP